MSITENGGPDGSEDLNETLSSPELLSTLSEDEVQRRVTSSDPTLYVWDLDETLIIFQTLRNGRYAELHKGYKDPQEACELGERWESLILDICDDYFFYKQVRLLSENTIVSSFLINSLYCLPSYAIFWAHLLGEQSMFSVTSWVGGYDLEIMRALSSS